MGKVTGLESGLRASQATAAPQPMSHATAVTFYLGEDLIRSQKPSSSPLFCRPKMRIFPIRTSPSIGPGVYTSAGSYEVDPVDL